MFFDLDLYAPFATYLPKLWPLWEIMVMGLPIMVCARAPQDACSTVGALLSLITPLPYAADFRPILTIHDPQLRDVQEGVAHTEAQPVPTVFGVMNPFFIHVRLPLLGLPVALYAYDAVQCTGTCDQSVRQSGVGDWQHGVGDASGAVDKSARARLQAQQARFPSVFPPLAC